MGLLIGVAGAEEVGGLTDGSDHLFGALDRVVRAVVFHRHLEVSVHHARVQIVAPAHVDRARWVQCSQHPVDALLATGSVASLLLDYIKQKQVAVKSSLNFFTLVQSTASIIT